jgi:hypothetical protein
MIPATLSPMLLQTQLTHKNKSKHERNRVKDGLGEGEKKKKTHENDE